MVVFLNFYYILILLLIGQVSAAPFLSSQQQAKQPDPICSSAQLIAPGQGSLIYKYKTEVKLSVANSQYDLKTEITAIVQIKSLGDCNYALQLRNVKVTETKDEDEEDVTSTASAQKELENLVVRFRWVDGFLVAVEADASAKVDHVNFIKGILSTLQVYSPVPNDGENVVREEDVLGVCTTLYKYTQKSGGVQIIKNKDLSTCSKDKLHLSSSPVLTSLLGPIMEEVFSTKTRYVCRTDITDKKIQAVKCKTIEIDAEETRKSSKKSTHDHHIHMDENSSEEDKEIDFTDKEDEEISGKHISIKQELTLQPGGVANVDAGAIKKAVRSSLQFVPTASFDKSNTVLSDLVTKIKTLLNSTNWNQFAAAGFVQISNELRRMDKFNLNQFKSRSDLKHLTTSFLNTVYAHDPEAAAINFDQQTLKFNNPLSVFYLENPSTELVDQILQGAKRLTPQQVPDFVRPAAAILKAYSDRQDKNKEAVAKIKEFQTAISKFLNTPGTDKTDATTAVLSAYGQFGLYDDKVYTLAANDQGPLEVQYHALNAIGKIDEDYIDDGKQLKIRTDLQNLLLKKLKNKSNKNAVRIWSYAAISSFIYNPEEEDSTLGDALEKELGDILDQPLDQVNGYIWSALKYSALDRLCPLRGLAARLRAHHDNKKQFAEQATLSSRTIQLELPLRKNYQAAIHLCVIFENDRVVPSFIGAELAFDGIRRETLRLPWVNLAIINENLDWNFADYIFRLDPSYKQSTDEEKAKAKSSLPAGLKKLQDAHDEKDEDPDPSVHLYLKLFGADISSRDVTDKIQDILRSNLRTFIRNQLLNRMKDLIGKDPIYRLPLEIGAASGAANGLTLYKSAQLGIVADLSTDIKDTRDSTGFGTFSLLSRSALSFSLTLQREIASTLISIGETIDIGVYSHVPFEVVFNANNEGRTREFNILNQQSTLLATDFQYSLRTSKGLETNTNKKTSSIDPSCTPSIVYRGLGLRACLELNPFRSIQLGSRPSYPITITLSKEPSIKKWRIGWRFNAQDAPQYEVAVEKVGSTETYSGLGISATKTGNNFEIKVLTGMKSFKVKGQQTGTKFSGTILSSDNKEVMTTSGTLNVGSDGFKLDTTLFDITTKRGLVTLTADILPNRGQGLIADIGLSSSDRSKSFKIHFRGDLYKPNSKLAHITGSFNLGDTTYNGKAHLERSDEQTRVELHRSMKIGRTASPSGHDFLYERKKTKGATQNTTNIQSHLTIRRAAQADPIKVFDLKADFVRSHCLSNATLNSALDFLIVTRNPPVQETIKLDYVRRSIRTSNQARQLISPEANLKIQVTTKSNVFSFLLDHKHRRSSEASKKGPETSPPTLDIENKIHVVADTDKLLPDIPRPFAFDVLSDLDFELLNKVNYKFQYDLRRRQRSASFTYNSLVTKVTQGHLFSGTSNSVLLWDNKQKKANATGNFEICLMRRTLKTHWDIDTNLVADKNDMELDLQVRFDRSPKSDSPRSFIGAYNVTIKAPKHEKFQLIDIDGNITRQVGIFETYNSIAYRRDKKLQEINIDVVVDRNQTGDGSLQTHLVLAIPFFKYIPYITHKLILQRATPAGRLSHIGSELTAKPVLAHYASIDIDRSKADHPPRVHVDNELEYLRSNGDNLYVMSKVDVHRWSTLHSFGLYKRNNDLLHEHSIGYIFSNKTRKVALSLSSPQISGNPLSIIGELTIDRENRIGKMKLPQEFGIHLEFGTPLTNLTAFHVFYNLPMFHEHDDQTVDATVGFKVASSNIAPIKFYLHAEGSLNTTLHLTESLRVGDDIALGGSLTAQYHPQEISQLSAVVNSKYYGQEFQNSLYALFKQHQVVVRGILNTTDNPDYRYEMDIGFDDDLLTGHTERTDGQQTTTSDIDAKKCSAMGKFSRCYRGDITIQTGQSGVGGKGSFNVSWGRGNAKLDVRVPNQIEIRFNHSHSGYLRAEDFNSQTNIEGRSLRSDNRGSFSYSGSVEKEDGKWNDIDLKTSMTDMKTGQKALATSIHLNNKITDKLSGQFKRKIHVNLEHKGQSVINWSSDSVSCARNPSAVFYGICQKSTFNVKASNQLAQRLRQRLNLPADPKLSTPSGQVNYDGTLDLDLKHDPKLGPHTVKLDVNRLKEDAVDLDLTYQPRVNDEPMSVNLKAELPKQKPMSVNYQETRKTSTSFNGVFKYSFNSADTSAEKTFQCDVDRPSTDDLTATCKGERTTVTIDIDRKAGKSKAYVDLNKYPGQRVGYEGTLNPQTKELDATLYTFVSSWNIKRQPKKSITLVVKQKTEEVLRVEGTKTSDNEIQVKFSPANIDVSLDWDNATVITLKQTSPQQRNLATLSIDRARIRHYIPSLRNKNRPSYDIDESVSTSRKPLFELALDSHVLLSLSQALDKLGFHNGQYGLDTIKKAFTLKIGDAPFTVYSIQHWKTHREDFQLPESYSLRLVNNGNGNIVQLATTKWNENRLISKVSFSLDGGRSLTTALKVNRFYALPVGSMYFYHSLGYRNIQGVKQLREHSRQFIRNHLTKDLNKTNLVELVMTFRKRVRAIIEKDYTAVKDIATAWSKEPENSFLRRYSARLGLLEFFDKYPTFGQAFDRLTTVLLERSVQRDEFWRGRIESIMNENRLKSLSDRVQAHRAELIKRLTERAEALLDRLLPKIDQANVEKRIQEYVTKLITGFEQVAKRNTEQWKTVFKAIDDATKGDDYKWFRTLVADIDSDAFSKAADAETTKVFKKLFDSSKLFVSNINQLSRGITKRREATRERVLNAIKHLPIASVNETNFELLFPVGRQPASYIGTSELIYGLGSLLRNRDQAFDTIRSILQTRLESRSETMKNYFKALRSLAKRLFKRKPSLTPEFKAVISSSGDAIDLHGNYIHFNPHCDYVLVHDFADLKSSIRFKKGEVQSVISNPGKIPDYECSSDGCIQACNHKNFTIITVPMHCGGRVYGALGDSRVRDTTGSANLNKYSLQSCSSTTDGQPKKGGSKILECASEDDDKQKFCEHFVQDGLNNGVDKRRLLAQVMEIRKETN